ncbi:MAG: flagellar protein export ATPase FliI [Clostridia bacterium]|nr:flagellar protein export ATPase FliI [Clostridia bacterium]
MNDLTSAVNLQKYIDRIPEVVLYRYIGKVARVIGLTVEVKGIRAFIGEICRVRVHDEDVLTEVVGFKDQFTLLMSLGDLKGISPGCRVYSTGKNHRIAVGSGLLGKVLDGLGNPLDSSSLKGLNDFYPVIARPPNPLDRKPIKDILTTGIKAIDGFLTLGEGQRIGIFSGSGVGKSTLMGMIAKKSSADINVIGLIGERGREVLEFIENDLGEEGLRRSVVVVVTSDQPALLRIKGSFVVHAIAEYFRDQGKKVMLMMDSVTRFAMAQREVGLAVGEPPTTKGYTPSVFALLPKLLERAGNTKKGSITALYNVLVDGDDFNEPIADAVRGILDGHIILSRELAARNHFPAIDILNSVSRLMVNITNAAQQTIANDIKTNLAVYKQNEDLISIGAYVKGTNPKIDRAILFNDSINQLLCQGINEVYPYNETLSLMTEVI